MDILFKSDFFPLLQNNRTKFSIEKYGKDFFLGKKMLELGPFNGAIGDYFRSLGADVLSAEGRSENINNINNNYPKLKTIQYDFNEPIWTLGYYDIIINFGVFYHLYKNHEKFFINCINNCELMFLDTEVVDSDDEKLEVKNIERGPSQSLIDYAIIKSVGYIESLLKSDKFCKEIFWKRFDSSEINGETHRFDWKAKNNGDYQGSNRRYYIVASNQQYLYSIPPKEIKKILDQLDSIYEPSTGHLCYLAYDTIKEIIEKTRPKNILEIGFNKGHSSTLFLSIDKNVHITSIDIKNNSECIKVLEQNFNKDIKRFDFVHINSGLMDINKLSKKVYDLVFIDGNHSLAQINKDIALAKKVNAKYILWDDYNGQLDVNKSIVENFSNYDEIDFQIYKSVNFNEDFEFTEMALLKIK